MTTQYYAVTQLLKVNNIENCRTTCNFKNMNLVKDIFKIE